ncbi:MAG TPA: M1 family aminopeptidase [Vicinamibacterales bacterium]|nr:M1 family aminopeptidase [Vicinamibacterales bacterium]
MLTRLILIACLLLAPQAAQPPSAAPDGIDRLMVALQTAIESGNVAEIQALTGAGLNMPAFSEFAANMAAGRRQSAVVKDRDRANIGNGRVRLLVEIFVQSGNEGRVSTWRMDVAPPRAGIDPAAAPWQIMQVEKITIVTGLYRLALDPKTQYDVRNLVIQEPDLTLTIPSAQAFVARAEEGPTALVLIGRGRALFSPHPAAERGQVRAFSGSETLNTEFNTLFIRLNPGVYESRVPADAFTPKTVNPREMRKATQLFEALVPQSFQIDLADLSGARWSLIPTGSDTVVEMGTRKYGTLTYAQASTQPEDISLFDRRRKKNIALYASEAKLAARGRFYSEDDDAEFDVRHYDLRTVFSPDRLWLDGVARISLTTRNPSSGTLTLRLADSLVVRSITSPMFGRLLHLRIVGQNSVLVGFPSSLPAGTALDLIVTYGGRLQPQSLDREAITVQQQALSEPLVIPPEPQYVYSNRSFWYPQAPTTDYATARMMVSVPAEFDAVASGVPAGPPTNQQDAEGHARKEYVFETARPARYLACVISRFGGRQTAQLQLPLANHDAREAIAHGPAVQDPTVSEPGQPSFSLYVEGNPRQANRTRSFADKAADILRFYTSLLGDVPYGSFTVALTEADVPGGHSPAYFAILNQPLPTTPFRWGNDPVAFQNYPSFFLAHEIAHQWWGQAVGWKNYHEQWLSEGFAQYFAALYAERERGADQFTSVLRQMRRTAMDQSPNGPVWLGYRLGHIKGDSRIFRALVYNKGAMVLHMLRRLLGDDAFFRGLRNFYATWRYKKAGTDDLRASMEAASGQSLERFFDRWIFDTELPSLRFTSRVDAAGVHVAFDQLTDEIFDVPVTVTITHADGSTEDVVVALHDKRTERLIPVRGEVRSVEVNRDAAALADIKE